jgi:hypothetical protein
MKVTLEVTGGIGAGLSYLVVDSGRLSSKDAADLRRLVEAVKAEPAARWGGQERLQVQDANGDVILDRELPLTEMPPALTALRKWVRERGKTTQAKR